MRPTPILLAVAILAGCTRGPDEANTKPTAKTGTDRPATAAEPSPDKVVVEVGDKGLTYGELTAQAKRQLSTFRGRIPEDSLPMVQQRLRDEIKKQFVARTLLLAEADRQGLVATDADEAKALQQIQRGLPQGVSIDDILANSPMGEKRLRQELLDGARIHKLLAAYAEGRVAVSNEEIAEYRSKNEQLLTVPESVRARHILIAVAPDDDEAVKTEKRKLAEGIRQKLLDGADFAMLAKTYSDDASSKKHGGDLGRFQRGRMVKPFEDAAFSQPVDAIGDLVETRIGYHIIQVTEHQDVTTLDDDAVRERIRAEKTKKLVDDYVDELRATADVKYYNE